MFTLKSLTFSLKVILVGWEYAPLTHVGISTKRNTICKASGSRWCNNCHPHCYPNAEWEFLCPSLLFICSWNSILHLFKFYCVFLHQVCEVLQHYFDMHIFSLDVFPFNSSLLSLCIVKVCVHTATCWFSRYKSALIKKKKKNQVYFTIWYISWPENV